MRMYILHEKEMLMEPAEAAGYKNIRNTNFK